MEEHGESSDAEAVRQQQLFTRGIQADAFSEAAQCSARDREQLHRDASGGPKPRPPALNRPRRHRWAGAVRPTYHLPLNHVPGAPEAAREKRRQHPPGRRTLGADEDQDLDHRHGHAGDDELPRAALTTVVHVEPASAATARARPVLVRTKELRLMGGEIDDGLVDERPALLPRAGRIRSGKAWICRRGSGPWWAHEVSESSQTRSASAPPALQFPDLRFDRRPARCAPWAGRQTAPPGPRRGDRDRRITRTRRRQTSRGPHGDRGSRGRQLSATSAGRPRRGSRIQVGTQHRSARSDAPPPEQEGGCRRA